jgi:hypothetical protein
MDTASIEFIPQTFFISGEFKGIAAEKSSNFRLDTITTRTQGAPR